MRFSSALIKARVIIRGQLYFDVMEENEEDEKKLRENYSSRYGAEKVDGTTMLISDNGHALIKKYLGEEQDSEST